MAHDVKLGELIDETQQRDAIHIAIAPVVAADGEKLYPGQDIGFVQTGDTSRVGAVSRPIGIVDPFLKRPVYQGDRFWMFLYPQTITSLRHDWTHPAFSPHQASTLTNEQARSQQWIEDYAGKIGVVPSELIANAKDWVKHEEFWSQGDRFEGLDLPTEFWSHYENVTGEKVPSDKRQSFFSCAC